MISVVRQKFALGLPVVWPHPIGLGLVVAVVAVSVVAAVPPAAVASSSGSNPFAGASPSTVVYFVPLDAHAQQLLKAIVPTLQRWLPANEQLGIARARRDWANRARDGELNTTKTAIDLLNEFRQVQGSREVAIFAVSSQFVYSPDAPYYSFVFGAWRQPHYLQYSVVFGTGPMRVYQPSRERVRLTKFMLRYIGEIVCSPYLQTNADPRSVMYSPVLGTADLDRMVATLPAHCRRN